MNHILRFTIVCMLQIAIGPVKLVTGQTIFATYKLSILTIWLSPNCTPNQRFSGPQKLFHFHKDITVSVRA